MRYVFNDYSVKGRGRRYARPSVKELNNHVVEAAAVKWKDLGFQLLSNGSAQNILNNIEADHQKEVSFKFYRWRLRTLLYNCCYHLAGC